MARRMKPKAEGAPTPNKSNVTDEVYQANLAEIMPLYADWQKAVEAAKSAQGAYRAALKKAKKDGCNADAIAAALKERKQDQDERKLFYRDMGRVLRLLGVPVGTQFSLLEETPSDPEVAGYEAAKSGVVNSDNPYPEGSNDHALWARGWDRYVTGQFTAAAPKAGGLGAAAA